MLGLVTIGQSPRVDVMAELLPLLAGRAHVEHGALDPMTADDIALLAPQPGEDLLVSRLRDGSSARMSHASVRPLLEDAIARCAADGASAVLLMCSGHLPDLAADVPVYGAEPLAHAALQRALTASHLGLLLPQPEQIAEAVPRWERTLSIRVSAETANPYSAPLDELVDAGERLAARGADVVVLDCFGYTNATAHAITAATGVPAHAVRMVAAHAALAIVDGAVAS